MPELLKALLVSASLGALLGLERQWSGERDKPKAEALAGARTFAVWAVLGTLCAWFSQNQHPAFFLLGFAGMFALIALTTYRNTANERQAGLTTGAVGLATYLLGGLVLFGQVKTAVVVAVSLVVLLASKERLHAWSRKFSRMDVYHALQFAAVTGIILPLVPDEPCGPYGAFNPHTIWLMVVLVSGLGFLGYVAMRLFGEGRGLAVTGILGGLASSTATTLALSRQSREAPDTGQVCALAVTLACTVMLARVAVLVGAVSLPLLSSLAPWLLLMALPGMAFSAANRRFFVAGNATGDGPREIRNPLSLRVAIQFALLYALIVLGVQWANANFGGGGVYWVSFLSGLTDLDAISLSLSQTARGGGIGLENATRAMLVAAGANSLLKLGLAASLGGATMRMPVSIVLGATAALAALAAWFA
ncbi:MAG: MgtC/SapB family protein [Chthoniobacterales bacterium]|nr:MgtC/SapB family protein [Chthoniobacterales bacterium]